MNPGSSVFLPLAGLCAVMFIMIMWVPKPYEWLPFLLLWLTLAILMGLILRVAWDSHWLTFVEEELVFPGRKIRANEIKHILSNKGSPSFTITFSQRKIPIRITFNDGNPESAQTELRLWAWRNGVTMNIIGERKEK